MGFNGARSTKSDENVRQRIEIGIDSNATVWDLKKLIGEEVVKRSLDGGKTYDYYPEPEAPEGSPAVKPIHPATIRLFQMATTQDLRDTSNGCTLKEMKFKSNENIGAFKKSDVRHRKAPILEES